MPVPVKLAAFAATLAITFGAAYGVGAAVGPVGDDDPPATSTTTTVVTHEGGHP